MWKIKLLGRVGSTLLCLTHGDAAVGYSVHNLGETNSNGVVDENDYQNAVNLALSAQYLENADMYYDGTLDALDISAFEKAVFSGIVPEI